MFDFDGFSAFNFNEGVAYISITPNGVTFNKSVTMKLNYPEFVQLLINGEKRQLLLMPCREDEKNATVFFRPRQNGVQSVRWNARDLINTIEYITGWRLKDSTYRVDGQMIPEWNAMLFDLDKAVELT